MCLRRLARYLESGFATQLEQVTVLIQVKGPFDGDIIYVNLIGLQLSDDVAEKFWCLFANLEVVQEAPEVDRVCILALEVPQVLLQHVEILRRIGNFLVL